jgi:hypothetical protein
VCIRAATPTLARPTAAKSRRTEHPEVNVGIGCNGRIAVVASAAGAQHVFSEFRNDPVRFVTAHKILIKGTTAGDNKLTGAAGDYENVVGFHFQYDAFRDKFEFNTDKMLNPILGASHAFQTVSVPAVYFYQVPGFTDENNSFAGVRGIKLTGAGGEPG